MSWRDRGACKGADTDLFYPERGQPSKAAKAICAGCVVRAECLDYALRKPEVLGVWGGMAERERRNYRGRWLKVQPDEHGTRKCYLRGCGGTGCRCDPCRAANAAFHRMSA